MRAKIFETSLRALSALMPYGKKMTDEEIQFVWMILPASVKQTVTDEMWGFACMQRRLDPNPNKELSLDLQILSYVYRRRDGHPAFDWGLKQDLQQRMELPGQFHEDMASLPVTSGHQLPPLSNPVLQSFNETSIQS